MFVSKTHLVEVFITKLILNIKSEASKTYLSYLWWILEPALHVAAFYVVFAVFLAQRTPDFLIFLFCGQIPFLWFSKSISNSSNSIVAGRGLINQVSISKMFFPMLVVAHDAFKQIFVFAFLITFLIFYGLELSWVWLYLGFIILTELLLIIAISLLVAAIIPFLPDFKYLVSTGMTMLMLGSGIFYDYKKVIIEQHQQLFLLNPMANLINNYRQVLLENTAPDWASLGDIILASLALIYIMSVFFKKMDSTYTQLVIQ